MFYGVLRIAGAWGNGQVCLTRMPFGRMRPLLGTMRTGSAARIRPIRSAQVATPLKGDEDVGLPPQRKAGPSRVATALRGDEDSGRPRRAGWRGRVATPLRG